MNTSCIIQKVRSQGVTTIIVTLEKTIETIVNKNATIIMEEEDDFIATSGVNSILMS